MLQHLPIWLGRWLRGRRAGHDRVLVARLDRAGDTGSIRLTSPAFGHGERLPARFTADGKGVSPPLAWDGIPDGAACLALIVEDADAPTRRPLVHAIIWDLPAEAGAIDEGAIVADGRGRERWDVGRNSYLREGWLAPDPPPGHGEHSYVFQMLALSDRPELGPSPGRGELTRAVTVAGRVMATGVLIGTYARG